MIKPYTILHLVLHQLGHNLIQLQATSTDHNNYKQGTICQIVSNPKKQTHISDVNTYPDLNHSDFPLATSSYIIIFKQ